MQEYIHQLYTLFWAAIFILSFARVLLNLYMVAADYSLP